MFSSAMIAEQAIHARSTAELETKSEARESGKSYASLMMPYSAPLSPDPDRAADGNRKTNKKTFKFFYKDVYEQIKKTWSPSVLPDYSHCNPTAISSESQSLNYFLNLQNKYRMDHITTLIRDMRATEVPANSGSLATSGSSKIEKQTKKTVWEFFSEWIEKAIQNGNPNAPVPGGSHPKQSDLHVLQLDRRFGHSNAFTVEDIVAVLPNS